jgi:DNA-binding transcriptional MerR regulator
MTAAPRSSALLTIRSPSRYPLSVETVARHSGVHPDLLRRFVALGLLDASQDASGRWCFAAGTPARVARIQRLHAGLCLNYAAIGVVLDLLERIAQLEVALRRSESSGPERPRSASQWT